MQIRFILLLIGMLICSGGLQAYLWQHIYNTSVMNDLLPLPNISCPSPSPCPPSPCPSTSPNAPSIPINAIPSLLPYKNEELYKYIISLQQQKTINLSAPRMIFSLNAGHTGSGYLFKILQAAGAYAFHEDNPSFVLRNHQLNNTCNKGLDATFTIRRELKIPYVDAQMAKLDSGWLPTINNRTGKPVYADASHMFFKVMHDFMMQEYVKRYQITIIILRRYLPEVARSNMVNYVMPTHIGTWENWIYRSHSCKFALTYPDPPPQDNTEIVYSYVVDLELQVRKFVHTWGMLPNVKFVEVNLEDLQKLDYTIDFLRTIGLGVDDADGVASIDTVLGKVYNSRNTSRFGELSSYETGLYNFIANRFEGQNLSFSMFHFDKPPAS